MREIYIDLSDDKYSPSVFGGYVGEHNETKVIIKLPDRMLTSDITRYQFVFKNSENKLIINDTVDVSDISNGRISSMLTEEHTLGNNLILSVSAIVESNSVVVRKAKTPIVSLKVRD